ncbi:MAG: tetratricopeptide repeat protein [Alphaproteobacteria bacterium]
MRRRFNPAVIATLLAMVIALVGAGIALYPVEVGHAPPETSASTPAPAPAPESPPSPPPPPPGDEALFTSAFIDGVTLLREGRADAALAMFEAARSRRPHSAAVWTNIGFAQLAREDHAAAVESFQTALNINSRQVNAFYGLAVALEAKGDLEAALGAMRTYLHLAPQDTEFYRNATGAVWEWGERLKAERANAPPPPSDPPAQPQPGETGR